MATFETYNLMGFEKTMTIDFFNEIFNHEYTFLNIYIGYPDFGSGSGLKKIITLGIGIEKNL